MIRIILLSSFFAVLVACTENAPPPQGDRVEVFDSGCATNTLVLGKDSCAKQVLIDYQPSDYWGCGIVPHGGGKYRLETQNCAKVAHCRHGAVYPPKVGQEAGAPDFMKHNRVIGEGDPGKTFILEVDCKNATTGKFVIDPN